MGEVWRVASLALHTSRHGKIRCRNQMDTASSCTSGIPDGNPPVAMLHFPMELQVSAVGPAAVIWQTCCVLAVAIKGRLVSYA